MLDFLVNILRDYGIYLMTIYLIIITIISNDPFLLLFSISTTLLILGKWITDINVCSVGMLECKLRQIKREDSYIYRILDGIVNINKTNIIYVYYLIYFSILIISIIKFYNTGFNLFRLKDYIKYINNKKNYIESKIQNTNNPNNSNNTNNSNNSNNTNNTNNSNNTNKSI
tara:strand:+ start:4492 stop:5004 length:513 start_codon:yes stop_codon:yes gene_type:complete